MSETSEPTPLPTQRIELIWPTGERRTADLLPDEVIHVGDRLTVNEHHLLCLDEDDEPDGTHVVGVCLREHYWLITWPRALDGEPIVVFGDEEDAR